MMPVTNVSINSEKQAFGSTIYRTEWHKRTLKVDNLPISELFPVPPASLKA
jgi:hypothetical protein